MQASSHQCSVNPHLILIGKRCRTIWNICLWVTDKDRVICDYQCVHNLIVFHNVLKRNTIIFCNLRKCIKLLDFIDHKAVTGHFFSSFQLSLNLFRCFCFDLIKLVLRQPRIQCALPVGIFAVILIRLRKLLIVFCTVWIGIQWFRICFVMLFFFLIREQIILYGRFTLCDSVCKYSIKFQLSIGILFRHRAKQDSRLIQ